VAITAIGMGRPNVAAYFKKEFDVPFRLLVDHDQETYKAINMKRGNLWEVAGPHVWFRFAKGILTGKGGKIAKEDVLQMGGVIVVDRGGKVRFEYRGEHAADNVPVADVLAALPANS
jgi:peroxiredoxin